MSLVLYCLIRSRTADGNVRFFLLRNKRGWTFPPTKFRPGEDLYSALARPMEEDLGLPAESYFPEEELPMIPNVQRSHSYAGLTERWFLYPVDVSLTPDSRALLETSKSERAWMTIEEVCRSTDEPNLLAIARHLMDERPDLLKDVRRGPSMDALASLWAAKNQGGVRLICGADIRSILAAGSRAFNLRVADPYLPYQRQGLGFTWSFFTPRDKQDVHVHGLPAIEIYGVLEGRLQVWHKPMNQRGARAWQRITLRPGDWLEVEPLHCHFAYWTGPEGLGTVFKAAGEGELAGVGRLGVAGKTTCLECSVKKQCLLHPRMPEISEQYSKPFEERDYAVIGSLSAEVET